MPGSPAEMKAYYAVQEKTPAPVVAPACPGGGGDSVKEL